MKQNHQIAYNYAQALKTQRAAEDLVCKALGSLGSDNQIFGLAEPVEASYTTLVTELLGAQLFDWLLWWMYETDYGTQQMQFTIDGTEYDPTTMTLYKFLELVD